MKRRRQSRLYASIVAAGLILVGALLVGINILGTSDEPVERAATPGTNLVNETEDLQRAAEQEAAFVASARKAAAEEAAKQEATEREAAPPQAAPSQAAVPPDTTMYLTIPGLGLYDIPVLEGSSEAVLSQGVGHVPGTGYPWAPGSNTYIAGHRLGYPGTISDHVFWDLPSLALGDQVILEDSLGQTYTYQVSEILEVAPTDLSVTGATGSDIVSLQTCIENYGDYWTPGPNWFARYIVRAERVV
ncbi:MAG: class E sortase [Actinomycetota bacterium]|nr:class E sortase [Actinomycetota bacterium]